MIIFNILIMGVILQLLCPFLPVLKRFYKTANIFLAISLFVCCIIAPLLIKDFQLHYEFINFKNIHLSIDLKYDNLGYILLCYIALIHLIVTKYSSTYLSFEQSNQFIHGKFWILTGSVMMFACSTSLISTFIAWQLINISLCYLLNHYAKNHEANQSATLQVITSRIGDGMFLAAIALSIHYFGKSDYQYFIRLSELNLTSDQKIVEIVIICLVVLSALIKCGQIPFHRWLICSMEAPTPVSVIMHAGVITAGGILFIKISPWLIQHPNILSFIAIWGLLTALLGKSFMMFQGDIKRQLAYSTIGQIGFMFFQCGFGCFISALFHIMTHGLFKSYLFLRVGSNLQKNNNPQIDNANVKNNCHFSSGVTLIYIAALTTVSYGIYFLITASILNPLFGLFGSFTLWSLINHTQHLKIHNQQKLMLYIILTVSYLSYVIALSLISMALEEVTSENQYSLLVNPPHFMLTCFIIISLLIFLSTRIQAKLKLTENISTLILARKEIVDDYKSRLHAHYKQITNIFSHFKSWRFALMAILIISAYLILFNHNSIPLGTDTLKSEHYSDIATIAIMCSLMVLILQTSFGSQFLNVKVAILSCIALITVNSLNGLPLMDEVNHYILLNISLLLTALFFIVKFSKICFSNKITKIYSTLILLLLLGVPGSAVFIYQIFSMHNTVLNSILAFTIIIITWVYTGQKQINTMLYNSNITNPNIKSDRRHLTFSLHTLCLSAIVINCISGLNPRLIINLIL